MQPLYNEIGSTYCATRRADPTIARTLAGLVEVQKGRRFLDLACGTGNYTTALASIGGEWHGCDISDVMINQARSKSPAIDWKLSKADSLPYQSKYFDGAMCTLAIHHFPDLLKPFQEVHRVLDQGVFALFTAFPEQMEGYWLCHYFPEMMKSSIVQMPAQTLVTAALESAGFEIEKIEPFYITNELQDLFLYSGKDRPNQYLDSAVRANISSFASRCSVEELSAGLERLSRDIESGEFSKVAASYQSTHGDYAYVVARKRRG
ncbi:MAG: class I SAM-dependent methyltransferase [Burkholderiaceae bacterium]|nr:class I SAM-dependent methyltransferase [Burkholderiaceae bacterium]